MTFFFINSRTLWKHFLWHNSYISTDLLNKQKQPFADVLQNRYSQKFRHIHRKTPVLESFLNKVTDLRVCSFIKQRLQLRCFHENIAKFLITAFFIKHLQWLLLNKVKTNVKSTWFILLPDWLYYVMTLSSKHIAKLQRYRSRNTLSSKHIAKLQRYRSRNTNKKHEKLKHRKTKA